MTIGILILCAGQMAEAYLLWRIFDRLQSVRAVMSAQDMARGDAAAVYAPSQHAAELFDFSQRSDARGITPPHKV